MADTRMTHVAKRELSKIALKIEVASDCAILHNNDQLFIIRPSDPLYRAVIPLQPLVKVQEGSIVPSIPLTHIDSP